MLINDIYFEGSKWNSYKNYNLGDIQLNLYEKMFSSVIL